MDLDDLDFENNFTMSLMAVFFYILATISVITYFIGFWVVSDSLLATIFLAPFLAIVLAFPAGIVLGLTSLVAALLVSGIRYFCFRRQTASEF